MTDARPELLNRYSMVVLVSPLRADVGTLRDKLEDYVSKGGNLLLCAEHAKQLFPEFGLQAAAIVPAVATLSYASGKQITEPYAFSRYAAAKLPDRAKRVLTYDGEPVMVEIPLGAGLVTLDLSAYGMAHEPVGLPAHPYVMLEHVKDVLEAKAEAVQLFSAGKSPHVQYITTRDPEGWYTLAVFNQSEAEQRFEIKSDHLSIDPKTFIEINVGDVAGSLECYDGDIASGKPQRLKYALTGGSGVELFKVDAANGNVLLTGKTKLDVGDRYTLEVIVSGSVDPTRIDKGVVTLLVQDPSSKAPALKGRTVEVNEDSPTKIRLSGLGATGGEAIAIFVVDHPLHGTLTGTAPNLVYTPDKNFSGTDRFTFQARNGDYRSPLAKLTIAVTGQNDASVFYSGQIDKDKGALLKPYKGHKRIESGKKNRSIGKGSETLSNNSGFASSIELSKPLNLRGASYLKIDFRMGAASSDSGGTLLVEFSNDGGSSWQTVERYDIAKEFVGGMWEAKLVSLKEKPHDFSANVKIRFRVEDVGNKASIFLDNICIARSKDPESPLTSD
jgi:hypothetical protein